MFSAAIHLGFAAAARRRWLARAVAVLVNYPLARRAVFLSKEPHRSTLLRYLALVVRKRGGVLSAPAVAQGLVRMERAGREDRGGIGAVHGELRDPARLGVRAAAASRQATDWDSYYRSPVPTAHLTRRYTGRVLVNALRRFGGKIERLVEIGGANSCFLETIQAGIAPREYHVIDTNAYGLSLLRGRKVITHQQSCSRSALDLEADAAFSIGLIEHFDPAGTRQAVASHFRLIRPGGCAIISFPTPTLLYRVARWLTEAVGAWKFPDERPL